MPKELYLTIDDDVARTIAKIQRANGSDLTLVFPKGSMVLSNVTNLRLLKKQIEQLGKNVSILTNDQNGQARAMEAGFTLMTFATMRQGIIPTAPIQPLSKPLVYKPVEQIPATPIIKVMPPIFETARFVHKPVYQPIPQPLPKEVKKIEEVKETSDLKAWLAVVFLSIILISLVVLLFFPHAEITIYAHTQALNRELQVAVDKSVVTPDPKNLTYPGVVFDKDQQFTKSYSATGKQNVGIKAMGSVQIYNYTGKTLKLKAATTTLTVGNNIYHFENDISGIKPTKNIPGTNTPDQGSLIPEVSVVADQGGDLYNVPAGTRFEIHNQVLGAASNLLYGYNSKPVDGGVTKLAALVTQQDLDKTKEDLTKNVLEASKAQLLNKFGLTLIDSGAEFVVSGVTYDKKVNDAAVNFNAEVTGHLKGLAFDKIGLQNLIAQRIGLTLESNQVLDTSTPKWDFNFKSVDFDKGLGILNAKYQGLIVSKIDPKEIEAKARGKSVADLKDLLLSDPNIDGADISLQPFWAKTLPGLSGRIKAIITKKTP
jgi:hypothetical protein